MMTLLTSFKPFTGDDALRQRNAVRSWRALGTDVEIIAFGRTPGLEADAAECMVRLVADIPAFEDRLPRIDKVFEYGEKHGLHDLLLYVNGDILLFPDLVDALNAPRLPQWAMVGRRTNVTVTEELSFSPDSASRLQEGLLASGRLEGYSAIDYLAWRRGSLPPLPPLFLGSVWDSRTVFCIRRAGVPLIDATRAARVIHQDHPYYQLTAEGRPDAHWGPAAAWCRAQIPDEGCGFAISDATHWLDSSLRLRPAWSSLDHATRFVENYPIARGWSTTWRPPFRAIGRLLWYAGRAWQRLVRGDAQMLASRSARDRPSGQGGSA